ALDDVGRARIPFAPVALRLPAGSVEGVAPDLVPAGHRQPDVVATSARPTGRGNLDGADAGNPTFHRVLDVDAAPSVDRLDRHVLDARPSQDRRRPPSLWGLRAAPVRHVDAGRDRDLVARDRRDLDNLTLVPVATRCGPHAVAALADSTVHD